HGVDPAACCRMQGVDDVLIRIQCPLHAEVEQDHTDDQAEHRVPDVEQQPGQRRECCARSDYQRTTTLVRDPARQQRRLYTFPGGTEGLLADVSTVQPR